MDKKILTTYEIARYCHVNISTVINWIGDGSLKAYRTKGGHRRVNKNNLIDFLTENGMPSYLHEGILIVDDETAIQEGLKELFENNGYKVDVAGNGFEAGILIEMKRPALLVLDLIMPGLDGFFVCNYVRKLKRLKHTKIIVLTGYPSKENIKKAKIAGANKVILKPVDNDAILNEVMKLIGVSHR